MNASIIMYHLSSRGVGSALRFNLCPIKIGDLDSGKIEIAMAPQNGNGFNWADTMCVRLNFDDVARMLMVFRGETESINDGSGITSGDSTFNMSHVIEPINGYRMILTMGDRLAAFMLKPAEALGISLALEHSMDKLVFDMEG